MVDINTLVLPGSDIEIVDAYDINDREKLQEWVCYPTATNVVFC